MPSVELEKPNSQYLSIAQSWFNLSDYFKAKEALDKITTEFQQHPEVLKLREQICKGASSIYSV
jgi:uncharacterized protein HemY